MAITEKTQSAIDRLENKVFGSKKFKKTADLDDVKALRDQLSSWERDLNRIERKAKIRKNTEDGFTSYVTEHGESISGIAMRQLGNERAWLSILEMNAKEYGILKSFEYFPVYSVIKLKSIID